MTNELTRAMAALMRDATPPDRVAPPYEPTPLDLEIRGHYVTYDPETGRIEQILACNDIDLDANSHPEFRLQPYDPDLVSPMFERHYVVDHEVRERPCFYSLPETMEVGETAKLMLPEGTSVTLNGQNSVLKDGRLELTADEPGVHSYAFERWPYQDLRGSIEVKP